MSPAVLPAHATKHVADLAYAVRGATFRLAQRDDGVSNGTALWLGAQCLSAFLAQLYGSGSSRRRTQQPARRPRVIELGSGIGLSALALCSMGWDAVATDLPGIVDAVLARNIANNLSELPSDSGTIQVRALDWTVAPDQWSWDDPKAIASVETPSTPLSADEGSTLGPPFDLIITADTIYSPDLTLPLLRTLKTLCELSISAADGGTRTQRGPPIYLCLERRDPVLVDQVLAEAAKTWTVKRVPHGKLSHAMEKSGLAWDKSEWEDVEIWTFTHMHA